MSVVQADSATICVQLPIWTNIEGEELYPHENVRACRACWLLACLWQLWLSQDQGDDFDAFENVNLVHASEYQSDRERLQAVVIDHFTNDH